MDLEVSFGEDGVRKFLTKNEASSVEFPEEGNFPGCHIDRICERLTFDIGEAVDNFPFTAVSCLGDSLETGKSVIYSPEERELVCSCRAGFLNGER